VIIAVFLFLYTKTVILVVYITTYYDNYLFHNVLALCTTWALVKSAC